MPHVLRHRASVYNGHPQRPVTLAPIAERLAVELLLPVNFLLPDQLPANHIIKKPKPAHDKLWHLIHII